jgi:hypothetical protein
MSAPYRRKLRLGETLGAIGSPGRKRASEATRPSVLVFVHSGRLILDNSRQYRTTSKSRADT